MESVLETAANHILESAGPQISSLVIKHFIKFHDEIHLKSTSHNGQSDQNCGSKLAQKSKTKPASVSSYFPKSDDTKIADDVPMALTVFSRADGKWHFAHTVMATAHDS
jgi:hypothetical protein